MSSAGEYVAAGLAIVPIPRGRKGPVAREWQTQTGAIRTVEAAARLNGCNLGLAHRWSGTCAVDIDDLDAARMWFAAQGLDVQRLLGADDAVQISSGRENRAKLLYKLPEDVEWLETLKPKGSGVELRCAAKDGTTTVQDVLPPSIHPDTKKPYQWIGDWRKLPSLPADLLNVWRVASTWNNPPEGGRPARENGARIAEGGRNDFLTSRAGSMRRAGFNQDVIEAALAVENNAKCDPPLPDSEVTAIAKSVARYAPAPLAAGLSPPPPYSELRLTDDELASANITPPCIVDNYLYADVAVLAAPGGVGKTTIVLYEAVCIALGRTVWGLHVALPGATIIVTAEDRRELCAARLRAIMVAMSLNDDERRNVLDRVFIWDVSGEQRRLATGGANGIELTSLADQIVEAYRENPPVLIVFDPLVSFGASEQMVNDNEQALITAARRIVRGLVCCVRLIHHTGKNNAREKMLDQYTGRGGSALPDGARMVSILQTWEGSTPAPPPGCTAEEGAQISILARAKLSYSRPQPRIWIKRKYFLFESFTETLTTPEDRLRRNADALEGWLTRELDAGRRHTKSGAEHLYDAIGLTRKDGRAALTQLLTSGRIEYRELPKAERHGGRRDYLAAISKPRGEVAEYS